MRTTHLVRFADARDPGALPEGGVALVVTSPPYPMIAMWDELFAGLDPRAADALAREDGDAAFEAMHVALDAVWAACARALLPGGILCVNVGDATRTLGGRFRLFSNHSRILAAMQRLGLDILPDILWRKPSNAPNKFMGSGMLPAGAYVTYEHEYILVLRKGPPRAFPSAADRALRRRSAFFWEERNAWFSDLWADVRGVGQGLGDRAARARSAAFPFEVAWRLVHMFSVQGDLVLDPFLGTGTTAAAALAAGRSSAGVERDPSLAPVIRAAMEGAPALGERAAAARLAAHAAFVAARTAEGRSPAHANLAYGFPVVTAQEVDLRLAAPEGVEELPDPAGLRFEARYRDPSPDR